MDQCLPCEARSGTHTEWVAITNNAGRSWKVHRTKMVGPGQVMFAGTRNGWTSNGWVSHDGGLSWSKASSPSWTIDDVTVVGDRVWAIAEGTGPGPTRVLTGAVTGSTLTPTPAQPFPTGFNPGMVIAPTTTSVYVQAFTSSGEVIKATDNRGASWHRVTAPCGPRRPGRVAAPDGGLAAFSAVRLEVACGDKSLKPPKLAYSVAFSDNGGQSWSRVPVPQSQLVTAQPVSPDVAWGTNGTGAILRTIDGGHSWTTVWSAVIPHGPPGTLENLTGIGPSTAYAAFQVTSSKDTYFLIRSTHNSGASWGPVAAFTLPQR
ncbi:MAG: sialidase family protein [Acidimicrobiales bacterium]